LYKVLAIASTKPRFPIAFLAGWCRSCGTIVRSYHNPTEKILIVTSVEAMLYRFSLKGLRPIYFSSDTYYSLQTIITIKFFSKVYTNQKLQTIITIQFFSISLHKPNSYPFASMRHITCSANTANVVNRIWNALLGL